ncbi:hypothetical protein AB0D49_18140 [Streptomyces sp. NPDC048290]|uniref:hypothetical protein n=1 Tax=Streptomyces sp. NPDC048290 TaxID=3155811 RepID=UPI00341E11C5
MPPFPPVRVRGLRYGAWRLVRRWRRVLAAGLAVMAAALVTLGPRAPADAGGDRADGLDGRARGHPAVGPHAGERKAVRQEPDEKVTAPVRIADAATVRLLRPGDRVDVVAAREPSADGDARVVARGALVTEVPEPVDEAVDDGALVVLSVPRATAVRLVDASTTGRLAVTLCGPGRTG